MSSSPRKYLSPVWVTISLVAVASVAWFVFDAATDKGIKPIFSVLLGTVFLGLMWVAWRTDENLPRPMTSLAEWRKPKALASAVSVFLSASLGLGGLVQIVSPRSSTESESGIIEAQTREGVEIGKKIFAKVDSDKSNRFGLVSSAPVFNGLGSSYRFKLVDSAGSDTELSCRIKILDENIAAYLTVVAKSCEDMSVSLGLSPLPASLKSGTQYEYSLATGVKIDVEEEGGRKHQLDEYVSFDDRKPPIRFKDQSDGISGESNNGIFGPRETAFGGSATYTVWSPPGYVCDWSDNSPFFHSEAATGSCSAVVKFMQDNPRIPTGISGKTVAGLFTGTLQVTVRSKQHGVWRKTSRPISTNIPDNVVRRWLYWYEKAPHKTPSDRIRSSLTSTSGPVTYCYLKGAAVKVTDRIAFTQCQCINFKNEIRGYEEFDWEFMRPANCK